MFADREYYATLLKIAIPIAIQNLIQSSLNAVGVLLIGQLGETSVAGVGLANQVFFLLTLMLFGISSGSAIFTAQFWGSGDIANIRRVVVLGLIMAVGAGTLFTVAALGFPRAILGIYTQDTQVIELGSQYLRIIAVSYLATAISITYAMQLRATGQVRIPMMVSAVALTVGTVLNYALIFGHLGLPAMGVRGAALGTCIARIMECATMVSVTYLGRLVTAARLSDLRGLNRAFVRRFIFTVWPVAANETIWSLGMTIYMMIYARIGTEAVAAINISSTIENLAFVIFFGIGNASAIMTGNRIGAGEEEQAYRYARRTLLLVVVLGVFMGALLILASGYVIGFYNISEAAAYNLRRILIVVGCSMWIRVANLTVIVGILRSGGDTRFSLLLDIGTVWLVGVPMALLGAFVFHLPVYWVVVMVLADEVVKLAGGIYRFLSRKWINNLARAPG